MIEVKLVTKLFHIYADGKTVKEISREKYQQLAKSNCHLLCILHDTEISFLKGNNYTWIPRKQLEQILNSEDC